MTFYSSFGPAISQTKSAFYFYFFSKKGVKIVLFGSVFEKRNGNMKTLKNRCFQIAGRGMRFLKGMILKAEHRF